MEEKFLKLDRKLHKIAIDLPKVYLVIDRHGKEK